MRRAICPGSFDPVTLGHLAIIGRASSIYDEVVVGVLVNKSKRGLFSVDERIKLLEESVAAYGNVRVDSFTGLLVDYCRAHQIPVIVRGVRAISDFEYEMEMNQLNRREAPDVDTLYLMTSPQYSFLSSSGVKELATFGGHIDDLVPAGVGDRLKEELDRQRTR